MNMTLWVLQVLLAAIVLAHGWSFLFPPAAIVDVTILHATRGEIGSAITTALLFVVATFVAYVRWKVKPIVPRTVA
jgi:hypothetical protein